MSNIDKRALREAAEKASTDNHTQDEWFHYLRCSTPETVLALLDELEKMQAQSSKWCEAFHKAVSVGARYEERIAELDEKYNSLGVAIDAAITRGVVPESHPLRSRLEMLVNYHKRIAELEALASLEAEDPERNPVLAYADSYRDMAKQGVESVPVWNVITDLERNIAPLFTATSAPVSVPAAMEMDDDFDSAFEHGKAVGWNAYRAAMLQSFGNSEQLNSPVIPDGWVLVPEEPTHEMLEAGDEQFGTYDVYRRMIEAAPKLE